MGLAIIKEGDLFRVYDVNGEATDFIATFNETDELDNYDYQCYFTETKDFVKAIARFSGDLFLRYEYDAPKGIMMDYYYKSGPDKGSKEVKKMIEDGNMRLSWKFSWIKYIQNNPGALELPSVLLIENALHQVYGGIQHEDE